MLLTSFVTVAGSEIPTLNVCLNNEKSTVLVVWFICIRAYRQGRSDTIFDSPLSCSVVQNGTDFGVISLIGAHSLGCALGVLSETGLTQMPSQLGLGVSPNGIIIPLRMSEDGPASFPCLIVGDDNSFSLRSFIGLLSPVIALVKQ